jgi:acetyl-CoA synthetase
MNDFWKSQEKNIIIREDKMNVVESVDRFAESSPDKNALVFQNEKRQINSYTYKRLKEETNKFANLLNKLNMKQDSRIAIFLPKCPEHYISFLGIIKHGSIPLPLFEAFQSEGLELRLNRGEVNLLVTNKELVKRLKHKPENMNIILIDSKEYKKEINSQKIEFKTVLKNKFDTAMMIFTSSTAGTPIAGIQIPHYGLVQQHYTAEFVLGLNKNENYWCTAHPAWVTGAVYGIISPLTIGCTTFVIEGRFDANSWISFLKENKISVLYTAPTALKMLKEKIKKQDLISLKRVSSVGEALPWSIFESYKSLGIEIIDTYWQTETGAIIIANLEKRKNSIGEAIGVNAKSDKGMIKIETPWPAMMTGIYKHEKMYKDYFEGNFFRTNDLAREKEGYFYFEGRKDDIIKTSGERVSPLEIENILLKHPSVKESAVIGVPDKTKGELIKAFIVLNKDFKETEKLKEDLSNFIKQNYAGHAYPKIISFVKDLPKGNSGKIIRMKLKEMK